MSNNGGQADPNDFRAIAPFVKPLTREDYMSSKAQIEKYRKMLSKVELEIDLQETARLGREAEQRLQKIRADGASLAGGPSSTGNFEHYPRANYQSQEVPSIARIEGEVQDLSNSSRPPMEGPLTQHNYPTAIQAHQSSFHAHTAQFPSQHLMQEASSGPQAATRSQGSYSHTFNRPTFAISDYQHSFVPSSTSTYSYKTPMGQSYQQRPSEEYWMQQSQKYAAELAAADTRPGGQILSTGVNPQPMSFSAAVIPQPAHIQHQTSLPTAVSEAAPTIPPTQRPTTSTEAHSSFKHRSSSRDATKPRKARQDFIREFQAVCKCNAAAINAFISTWPVPGEWLIEAASSVDPANLKDASASMLLNHLRKFFKISPQSTSSTSPNRDVSVPKSAEVPPKNPATTSRRSPPPMDPLSTQQNSLPFDTKEKCISYFHEVFRLGGADKAADFFVQYQSEISPEWQQALMSSLTPEQVTQIRHYASQRAEEAAKNRLPSSSTAKSDESRNNNFQQNRSLQTVTQSTSSTGSPRSVPVPPRPSVTKTQVQSTSSKPLQTSTSNHTSANTFMTSVTQATSSVQTSTPTTQPPPLVPMAQPTIPQQQSLTGTIPYGSHYQYGVPPPLSVPIADGKYVGYVYDPHLSRYVREDMVDRPRMPSNSSTSNIQPPPIVAPEDVSTSTQVQAVISIPPATPSRKLSGTTTSTRTPQQADKSRLARDILRSLGMEEPPILVAEEEEESDEEVGVLDGLSATAEHLQTQDSSHESSHEAPPNTNFVLSPLLMDQSPARPEQNPLEPLTIDLTVDDETSTVAPGDSAALPMPPPSITALITAPTSPDRDGLRHEVDEVLPPKSLPPATASGAASTSSHQDGLVSRIDGMSIAASIHHLEPNREDEHMDVISFPDLDEPLPSFPEPTGSSFPLPSFRVQSREQTEGVGDEILPLFLPSPSASPAPSEHSYAPLPPETDDEIVIVKTMLRDVSSSKRHGDLVVLPLDDERSLTPPQNVRKKKGQRAYVLVPPPPPDLRRAIKKRKLEESGLVSGSEEEETKYNRFEKAFIADSKFRMVERPCQWAECDALMNSGENLYLHLKLHMQETSSNGLYVCCWLGCSRRVKSEAAMAKHLERHSYFPLSCPIANCSDVFDKPFKAIVHELHQRQESARVPAMKQPSSPHVPKIPSKLDPLPRILPSYRVEPRHIRQAVIPPQRHSVIGPWVLQNIFSPVEQNLRKQNAPMRLRYPRQDARPEDVDNLRARPDEYDFLASLSTSPSRNIRYDDLDSEQVSVALHDGLMLWDTNSEAVMPRPERDADPGEETRDGSGSGCIPSTVTVSGALEEEEAVEMML